jgi:murein DD-endopeptidase MepM/ murein hydrolase activator NlpD
MSLKSTSQCKPNNLLRLALAVIIIGGIVGGYFTYRWLNRGDGRRFIYLRQFFNNPEAHPEWTIQANTSCGEAPFQMPTTGYIGFLWDDSFRPGHRHQGIDIFAGKDPGVEPVYAAYDGYLTRLPDWVSTVIIRIPEDPLRPTRQIWAYYTHMAHRSGDSYIVDQFPPGTSEIFVEAGTLLGYQGNYSGDPNNPTGVHLHFSIVKDDGNGSFLNELQISNTLDPSAYLGLPVNANTNSDEIPVCEEGS